MEFNLGQLADFHIILFLSMILLAWKWGDWRNWKIYYPTILYYSLWSLTQSVLTYNHPYWEYESPLMKSALTDILTTYIVFPATALLFLTHYPKERPKQAGYIILWVAFYTLLEIISYQLGFFSYHNGWHLKLSIAFNFVLFSTLRLHHKNPPRAWVVSVIAAILFVVYFKLPFSSLK